MRSISKKAVGIAIIYGALQCTRAIADPQFDDCFIQAGKRYNIEPNLLKAIAHIESSLNPHATNGVGDLGLMQINPFWFPKLAQFGITKSHLKNPCININIGAWVLAQNFASYGRDWNAVGRYHAGSRNDGPTLKRMLNYAAKVEAIYIKLTKTGD